jgi:hypothetical protein
MRSDYRFIGLFAPLLAKMLGARRLLARLMLAALIGALILWLSISLFSGWPMDGSLHRLGDRADWRAAAAVAAAALAQHERALDGCRR